MALNEEGEFELVLGNKQLLSVFFIVVVLLGVFFTMGYIVGRNTAPAGAQLASSEAGQPGPIVVEPPPAPQADKPSPVAPVVEAPKAVASAPPAETAAPKEVPRPAAAPPTAAPPPAAPPPQAARPAPGSPPPGTYLQVVAARRPEAELLAEVLTKKGFSAYTQPVPDSTLIRVLVGPLPNDEAVVRTRAELEAAGFQSFVRRI